MAYRQINFNYCAQCKQLDKEIVYNCRWLQFSFCCLTCLKRFHAKIGRVCDLCGKHLDFSRIHVRDDVLNDNNNTFVFICDQCFDRRTPFAVHCHSCAKVCYKGFEFGAHPLTVSGLISKYLCSADCKTKSDSMKVARTEICSECGIQGKCDSIRCDSYNYAICSSTVCLENIQKSHQIQIDNCDKCSAKFANNVNHEHVIVDRGTWKSFCCAECVYAHVRDDTQMVVCCMCQHRQRFYNCIRRNCDDRRFCSVNCAIAAETGIEQLMQNDERCHSEYLSLIRTPFESDSESESNDSFEDCVSFDETITATDQVSDNSDSGVVSVLFNSKTEEETVSIQYEITPELLERLTTAPRLQPRDYASKCHRCRDDFKSDRSTVQWEILEFCSIGCYTSFTLSYNHLNCTMCSSDYDPYCNIVCTHVVGNRLHLFCSVDCAKAFFSLPIFCQFCRSTIDPENDLKGFCQEECRRRYDQLYVTPTTEVKECTQCRLVKEGNITTSTNITLLFADKAFSFCSFPCYFYRALSCGMFPEQCTTCQIYFVRNQTDSAHMLHHNNKLNVFCSQSCQSHYVYKYQLLEMCTICRRRKTNFNMIKTVVNGTAIKVNYCSLQCALVVEESTALERVFKESQRKKPLN